MTRDRYFAKYEPRTLSPGSRRLAESMGAAVIYDNGEISIRALNPKNGGNPLGRGGKGDPLTDRIIRENMHLHPRELAEMTGLRETAIRTRIWRIKREGACERA